MPKGTPIPCSETVHVLFHKTAFKYSGRFYVKFRVQTHPVKVNHVDARYVATSFKYLNEFCVSNHENVKFVCLDDKAIVQVVKQGMLIKK